MLLPQPGGFQGFGPSREELHPDALPFTDRPNCRMAFGPPAPSLSAEPAVAITDLAVTALLGRSLSVEALLQQLVQIGLGAVLVLVERVHEL